MPPKQKQTIIKKPAGNGNISITIENNLKNTNTIPPVVKKRRKRRNKAPTEAVNLPPLPPLKDVSYIKPPSDRFTVWRDNLDDSFNTTIPQGQAQQMGLLRSLATPAITNQPPPRPTVPTGQISTQTGPEQQSFQTQIGPEQQSIETQTANYDPLGISDAESITSLPNYSRFVPNDETSSISSYFTAPSIQSYLTAPSIAPSRAASIAPSASSLSSDFMRQMNQLTIGLGRGNAYDNLQYDPYGNEAIEDRFSDRSSLASYYTADPTRAPSPVDQERSPTPPPAARQRSPTTPPPAQERSPTPPPASRQRSSIPFAVDIYEELAEEIPGISVDEAGQMLAADEDATPNDIQEFNKGKQSIFTTAKSMGKKHGRSGKDMQGKYFHMQEYIDSYLAGRGERDAKNFMTMDEDMLSIDAEDFYKNSFNRIKNLVAKGTPIRQTRAKTRAKSRIEDMEAGSVEF
jgi:hypothetical protein